MEKNIFDGIDGLIGKSYSMIGEDVYLTYPAIELKEKYF